MKLKFKSLIALLLVLAMALSLCACGKGGEEAQDKPAQGGESSPAPEFTYKAEYRELSGGSSSDMTPLLIADGGFYLRSSEKVGERPIPEGVTPEYEGQYDITEPRLVFGSFDGGVSPLEAYVPVEPEIDGEGKRDFNTSQNIQGLRLNESGNLVVLESTYCSWSEAAEDIKADNPEYFESLKTESAYYIRELDKTGAELSRGRLEIDDPEGFYTSGMELDEQGNLVLAVSTNAGSGIYAYKPDGSLAYKIEHGGYVYSMAKLRDGRVCVFFYDMGSSMRLKVIDSAGGSFDSQDYAMNYNVYELISGGGDYDLYYTDGTRFCGYRLEDESTETLFDWLNCDVNSNLLDMVAISEDGLIHGFLSSYDENKEVWNYEYITVSKVPYDSVPQKETLSMAVMYMEYTTQNAVIDFNRSSDKYRIEVTDYSQYNSPEDWTAGVTKLNTEIMAGNMPDILSVSMQIPYQQLAAKDLLEDLYPYLEADGQLKREDFFPNVLGAMEIDGKLYAACSGFMVQTAIGASSVVGDTPGWTYDDYYAALSTMPEGCDGIDVGVDRDTILEVCLALDMTDYVDWNAGTCSFDSGDFTKVLEFASQFPDASYYENYEYTAEDSIPSRVSQGKQMLTVASFSSTDFFMYDYDQLFGGRATCVGFPTNSGVGNILAMGESYAMSSSCANKEAAWQFLRGFLTEEYQSSIYYLPTNMNAFEASLEKSMQVVYEQDVNGNYILDENGERIPLSRGSVSDGVNTTEIYATTPRQAEMLREVIASATKMMDYDTSIINIVKEEAAAYFAGQKSAEEVTKLIQSKANIYINEQK